MLVPLHGIASRHDLPLPFGYVVVGAALALAVSFLVLLLAWRRPRFPELTGRALPGLTQLVDHPATRLVARLLVLAVYAWAALALMAGQDLLTNPVFGFVFVWVWVGLVPISLLLGGFWRATNPLRTIHDGLSRLAGVDPDQGLVRLPERIGVWPAAAALFAFAWLELVQPDQPVVGVGAGQPAEPVVDRAQRVGRTPEAAEQQRDGHQTDPDPHEDEAEHRVGQQVLAGHQGQARPGVHREDQQPGDQPGGRMVDDPGRTRQRASAQLGEPRLPPGQQQDDEGEGERQPSPDQDEPEG